MEIKVLASGSTGNAYLIQGGKDKLLIECGIPFTVLRIKLWELGIQVTELDGCLISHSHKDHCHAVPELLRHSVDCYMDAETAGALEIVGHHRVHLITPEFNANYDVSKHIGDWIIKGFDAIHDVSCLGYLIAHGDNRLLYLSDSAYSPYTFPGLTYIMVGCNYALDILNDNIEKGIVDQAAKARLLHSHASIDTVKDMLKANDTSAVQEIHLIHVSERNGDKERFKKEIQQATGKVVHVC